MNNDGFRTEILKEKNGLMLINQDIYILKRDINLFIYFPMSITHHVYGTKKISSSS